MLPIDLKEYRPDSWHWSVVVGLVLVVATDFTFFYTMTRAVLG